MTATDIAGKRIYIADLAPDEQGTLDELVVLWRAKRRRNALRAAFYDMQNATDALMTAKVPAVIRRRKFVLGWSAIAVDKLARRCNLEGFYDPSGRDLSTLGLDDLLQANRFKLDFNQVGVSSLIHAVAFIVTTQGDTAAGEPEVLMLGRDALTSAGVWDVRRRAISRFLSITKLDDDGEPIELTMYLPNLNVMMAKGNGGQWTVARRTHAYGVPVDPIRYKPRLGRPFGSSRISRSVMSLHMQALGTMIRADVNGEAYSMPRYALLGATEEAFKNADGSPKPTWQAAWDAIWAIGDDPDAPTDALARADIKQFNGQSPEPQNQHLRMLAQLFSGETGIPVGELGIVSDANPTSAEALTVSRDDIISEAESTTDNWSPDVSAAVTRGLSMLNDSLPEGLDVRPRWRSPVHQSRAAVVDAGQKQVAAVPWLAETEVGLRLLGLSEADVAQALAERQRAMSRANVTALAALAQQRTASDAVEG